jgi:predicted transcriptional regulator
MVTVTCRVPAEVAQAIEALAAGANTARADIIRAALARGLGSGVRKAVRGTG